MKQPIVYILLFLSQVGHAFDLMPQYQTSLDQKNTDFALSRLDSEYSSQVLNLSLPLETKMTPNSLNMSMGSISGKEFLIQQGLQIHKDLNEHVPFRFFWWQDGDRETDSEQFLWSLGYKITDHLQAYAIGNSFNNKARNDVGVELVYQGSEKSKLNFVYFKPDFQKNKRNLSTDRWDTSPQMFYLGYSSTGVHVFVRHEPKNRSFFTDSADTSSILKDTLGGTWLEDQYSAQIQYDVVEEKINTRITELKQLQSRAYYHFQYSDLQFRAGLAYFIWQYERGTEFADFYDLIPNIMVDHGSFSYGYDVTFRNSNGKTTLSEYADQDEIENRFVVRWNAVDKENSSFALLFTFDIDEFGGSETWEGGGANLMINF